MRLHPLTWIGFVAALLLGLTLLDGKARAQSGAHGDGHQERHDWYKELKQPITNYSCCTKVNQEAETGDCRPTRADIDDDGEWIALLDVPHDRDTKFTRSFRAIVASGNVEPMVLPAQSPNLNAFAERWVRSVRRSACPGSSCSESARCDGR